MKKRLLLFLLLLMTLLCLCSCSEEKEESTFSIQFIDVGQGDAALVECDGHYMLIDGGETSAGDKVYNVLEEKGIRKLDILAVSHLHTDHYGGLIKALTYASKIGVTISNEAYSDNETFRKFEHVLKINSTKIKVPECGKEYKLGSAKVKVIDSHAGETNDSLVLLITYDKTRFLFTGDIMANGQLRVREALQQKEGVLSDNKDWVSLIKMPHHGAYNDKYGFQDSNLNALLYEYEPSYFVISVGANNQYNHPHQETLDLLESFVEIMGLNWDRHVYRTDEQGDVIVRSNGKELSFETSK